MTFLPTLWRRLRYKFFLPRRTRSPEQAENDLRLLIDEGYLIVEMRCSWCEAVHTAAIFPENLHAKTECHVCHRMEMVVTKNCVG